jgi:hypothetical protein
MCCSRPRQAISTETRRTVRPFAVNPKPSAVAADPVRVALSLPKPVFEYVGVTALTVVSPVTRKTYRFERPGTRVEVDVRDRSWVAFVPNLVPVG